MTTPPPGALGDATSGIGDPPVILDPSASVIRLLKLQRTWDWVVLSESAGKALVSGAGRREHFLAVLRHYARERILVRAEQGQPQSTGDLLKVFGHSAFQISPLEKEQLLGGDQRRGAGGMPSYLDRVRGPSRDAPREPPMPRRERAPVATAPQVTSPAGVEPDGAPPRRATPARGSLAAALPDADTLEGWLRVHPDEVLAQMRASTVDDYADHHPVAYEALSVAWAQTMIRIGRLHAGQLPAHVQTWLADDARVRLDDESLPNVESARARAALIDTMVARVPLARSARDAAQPTPDAIRGPGWRLRSGARSPRQFNVPRDLPESPAGPVRWVLGPKGARPTDAPDAHVTTPVPGPPSFDDIPPPTDADGEFAWPEQFVPDIEFVEDIAPDYLPEETTLRYEPTAAPVAPRVTPAPTTCQARCYTARDLVEGEVVGIEAGMARITRVGATSAERVGPLHRVDGPAIEVKDAPERDRFFDDGSEHVLKLPPALARARDFASRVYAQWRAEGYRGADARETASRLLHTVVAEDALTHLLGALRASTQPSDVVFLHAFNTGYGMPRPEQEGGLGQ